MRFAVMLLNPEAIFAVVLVIINCLLAKYSAKKEKTYFGKYCTLINKNEQVDSKKAEKRRLKYIIICLFIIFAVPWIFPGNYIMFVYGFILSLLGMVAVRHLSNIYKYHDVNSNQDEISGHLNISESMYFRQAAYTCLVAAVPVFIAFIYIRTPFLLGVLLGPLLIFIKYLLKSKADSKKNRLLLLTAIFILGFVSLSLLPYISADARYGQALYNAQQGNPEFQYEIGNYYSLKADQNYKKAAYWYNEALYNGNEDAANGLGVLYQKGNGVFKNIKRAVFLYNEALKNGNTAASNNLGLLYMKGKGGIKKDVAKGFDMIKKAALNGDLEAECNLGVIYFKGAEGVNTDNLKAYEWIKKAAYKNSPEGQYYLAVIYMEGKTTPQDYQKAFFWAYLALKNGYSQAIELLQEIDEHLTQEQRNIELLKIKKWFKTHSQEGFEAIISKDERQNAGG